MTRLSPAAADSSKAALLLFSGGQDSAICLAWALERFDRVETVGFEYGQRHNVEMACRLDVRREIAAQNPHWQEKLGEDHVLDLKALGEISDTALTRTREIEMQADGLPSTFVPGRNIIFLSFAAALAWRRNTGHIVAGICESDYSGYPDCREDFFRAMQVTLNLGMETGFRLHAPLMDETKAQSWALAEKLGGKKLVETIRVHSHSCYLGERGKLHAWGYGCGVCPACRLRARGWKEYAEKSGKETGL